MGMSVHVYGLKPATEDYRKRLDIYKGCIELDINPPEELKEYFDYNSYPCEEGIVIDIPSGLIKYDTDFHHASEYYDVDVTRLPEGVTKVRFEISY